MRRYDDPVEVRKAMVAGPGGRQEGPEQFLWRDRLWKVSGVLGHWVETGPWWESAEARAVLGTADPAPEPPAGTPADTPAGHPADPSPDPGAERELWRVEASRGPVSGHGVFDLELDWARGSWRLVRCLD